MIVDHDIPYRYDFLNYFSQVNGKLVDRFNNSVDIICGDVYLS